MMQTNKPSTNALKFLVFDIETIPYKDEELSDLQRNYLDRRINTVKLRNPDVDMEAESGKIKSTDPYLGKVICIGLYYPEINRELTLIGHEVDILRKFWAEIKDFNGGYISYNGTRFDVPFIMKRSIHYNLLPTNRTFLYHTTYNPCPPHYDVYVMMCGRDGPSYGLKHVCDFLGIPSPKDGAVSAENVAKAYDDGRIIEIAEYCMRDIKSTYEAFNKVFPFVVLKLY
jgi:3'-5' exonuclease